MLRMCLRVALVVFSVANVFSVVLVIFNGVDVLVLLIILNLVNVFRPVSNLKFRGCLVLH